MLKMILKRILQLIPVLLITMSITFVITRVLPGNPAVSILGPQASSEDIEKMEEEMGLNDPMPVQYVKYMAGVLTGDLGTSYRYNRPVAELILGKTAKYHTASSHKSGVGITDWSSAWNFISSEAILHFRLCCNDNRFGWCIHAGVLAGVDAGIGV